MSKLAWLLFGLSFFTGALGLGTDPQHGQSTAFIASGVFASLLVLALFVGRRIKFDPILR
jgi:hypothetical protein